MTLIEFVSQLRDPNTADLLLAEVIPRVEAYQVDVYMTPDLGVDSHVQLFDAEAMPNKLHVSVDGIEYVNLFPLRMVRDFVEEITLNDGVADSEIAASLIKYRINDA